VLTDFDPMQPDQAANPYPLLARARADCPVFYMRRYDLWCVVRYDDALAIIRDPRTYSMWAT
jgi:cytochrome P450